MFFEKKLLPRNLISNESRHVVIDSTGLKIFGEGEWKVRQHGYDKRRTWRKLHVGIDEQTQEVVAAVVTTNDIKDNEIGCVRIFLNPFKRMLKLLIFG